MTNLKTLACIALTCLLAACDSGLTSENAEINSAPSSFQAQLSSGQLMAGSAVQDQLSSSAEFEGVFTSYKISRDEGNLHYTAILLRAESGEKILLGHVHEGENAQAGQFSIESSRDLEAPFSFISAYQADSSRMLGQTGVVDLTIDAENVSGTFEITYADVESNESLSIAGSFSATPGEVTDNTGRGGDRGDNGDRGDAGDRGDSGDRGDAGDRGDRGDAGDRGDRGDGGDRGDRGDGGDRGDRGDGGDRGDSGDRGDNGRNG